MGKKILIIMFITLIILGSIFIWYPRGGTFNKLVINKFKHDELAWITIKDATSNSVVTIKNKEDIEKIVNNIKNISLKENNNFEDNSIASSYITFQYLKTSIDIRIIDKNHIKISSTTPGRYNNRIYNIIKGEIDIESLSENR